MGRPTPYAFHRESLAALWSFTMKHAPLWSSTVQGGGKRRSGMTDYSPAGRPAGLARAFSMAA